MKHSAKVVMGPKAQVYAANRRWRRVIVTTYLRPGKIRSLLFKTFADSIRFHANRHCSVLDRGRLVSY